MCRHATTVSTALRTSAKWHVAAATAAGVPASLRLSSVMTPSVPSLPTMSRVRSYLGGEVS